MSEIDNVTLMIEGSPLICQKKDLVSNSDYFKAMFEGDFLEKNKDTVTLEGVGKKSMSLILGLIFDHSMPINREDMIQVLEAASMFQFNSIQELCIERLTQYLEPSTCLETWVVSDKLGIKSLAAKAKLLALNSFADIKDLPCILGLNIEEIHSYLGSVYLKTDIEMTVFETVMRWWDKKSEALSSDILLSLLSCVSFKDLSLPDLKQAMLNQHIKDSEDIYDVFKCMAAIKTDEPIKYPSHTQEIAEYFLNSRSRMTLYRPCIVVDPSTALKRKLAFRDAYRRKIYVDPSLQKINLMMYDAVTETFEVYLELKMKKFLAPESRIVSCENLIFMLGRNNEIQPGDKPQLWVYDTFKGTWKYKNLALWTFPEVCVVGNKLYIMGRRYPPTDFPSAYLVWYDFKCDVWGEPFQIQNIMKCCCYAGKLLLIDLGTRKAYLCEDARLVEIDVEEAIPQGDFQVFSYKERLFLKGQNLVELALKDTSISVVSTERMTDIEYYEIDVAVCNELVYTLYCHNQLYSLEQYNLETKATNFILKDVGNGNYITFNGISYKIPWHDILFSCENYRDIDKNDINLVNNIKDFPG